MQLHHPTAIGLVIVSLVTGCASSEPISGTEDETGSGGTGAGTSGAGGGATASSTSAGVGGGGAVTPDKVELVYGHTQTVLYKLDPADNSVTEVGPFVGVESAMVDIAVDRDSNMYGATYGGLYAIDRTTAQCTLIAEGKTYPFALSFVPAGTVDPDVEALVGYQKDKYVRIDLGSGAIEEIGAISGWEASGDLVAIEEGEKAYLTIRDLGNGGAPCPQCACQDCIVQVNTSTGDLLKSYGKVGHPDVWGLAFWGGTAYGFTEAGELLQLSFGTDSISVTSIPIPGAPTGLSFYGAGSTTSAPDEMPF